MTAKTKKITVKMPFLVSAFKTSFLILRWPLFFFTPFLFLTTLLLPIPRSRWYQFTNDYVFFQSLQFINFALDTGID